MKQKRYIMPVLGVAFSLMTLAHAAVERTIDLTAGPAGKSANGSVEINTNSDNRKEITINTQGLRPGEVYTVWLVSRKPSTIPFWRKRRGIMSPKFDMATRPFSRERRGIMKPKVDMAGLGSGDYSFTSDTEGNGLYTATVSGAGWKKWQQIKIAFHPDGDPTNMKNMMFVLNGDLK